jgi:hypothetical protein
MECAEVSKSRDLLDIEVLPRLDAIRFLIDAMQAGTLPEADCRKAMQALLQRAIQVVDEYEL